MAKKPKIKIRNTFKGNVGQVNNIDTYQGCFEGPKLKLIVFLLLAILSILTKKTYAGHNIDNAKNTIQLDDSISQEEINKRYRGLFLMFVLSAILMAFWYPALFNHHPVGAPASYMAAGGFFAMSLFLLKYKKAVKQQIHVNLVAKKQGY